jgi:hypothetical protein
VDPTPTGWERRPSSPARDADLFRDGLELLLGAATPETPISAIQRREPCFRASWQEDGANTKLLRTALGRYRAFFDLLTKV